MSRIEMYVLEHGFYSMEYIEVPEYIKERQSQDAFLSWLHSFQEPYITPISTLFPSYPDLEAVFVSNWLEDSNESID